MDLFSNTEEKHEKIISLILVLTLILSAFTLAGCSGDGQADENAITVCVVVSQLSATSPLTIQQRKADQLAEEFGGKCDHDRMSRRKFQAEHDAGSRRVGFCDPCRLAVL